MKIFQRTQSWAVLFLLCILTILVSCDNKGGPGGGKTGLGALGMSGFEGDYVLTQFTVTSQSQPSVVLDQSHRALSAFVTAKGDGSLSILAQSPGCERDPSASDCKTPVINNSDQMSGTWEKKDDKYLLKIKNPDQPQQLELTLALQQEGSAVVAAGLQTGGPVDMNLESGGLHDGNISKIVLQKVLQETTPSDLVGTYEMNIPVSKVYSNVDDRARPLMDSAVTSAKITLSADGHFKVEQSGGSTSTGPEGTYQVVDRNHLTVTSPEGTKNFVYRFLKDQGRLTLWGYNDKNNFRDGGPDVSTTLQVELKKVQ